MSLMPLLFRSKSLSGVKGQGGVYKLREGRLPKFAPAKRPISLTPTPNLEKAVTRTTMFEQKKSAPVAAKIEKPFVAAGESKNKNLANMKTLNPLKTKLAARIFSVVGENLRTLKSTIVELFSNGQSRRKTANATVQSELHLDKIKPLRNDLSDADLEVVEQKPKMYLSMSERELSRAGWTRHAVHFINPKTGYQVRKDVIVQKNPDVVEVSSASDLAAFIQQESGREKTAELFAQV